jgi:3-phenylpropionate/cinnamic acid dioxygenase small subunit
VLIAEIGIVVIMLNRFEREQTRYRHDLRTDLHIVVNDTEERLERRIERIENVSIGFRQHGEGS